MPATYSRVITPMKITIVVASGVGENDSRQDGNDQNGVTEILPQEFRRDDAEKREAENQHGQLENV